jgi:drug/metabolite transporter (DMT)-like permease
VHLLLPLLSSFLYVAGALFVKQAAGLGVGAWRTAFVANLVCAFFFLFLVGLRGEAFYLELLWQPALVGLLFLAGQVLSFLALQKGDVSVATPVMGVKVVLVAVFTVVVLGQPVLWTLWLAALLSSVGIAFLNVAPAGGHRYLGRTIGLSLLAAASFALFDILVQKWAPFWGAGYFLPLMMGFVGIYSFGLIPFFHAPLGEIPRGAWGPLLGAGLFIAWQGMFLIVALAIFGEATAVNVVYSARGLWSVLAVWWLGHWFANREAEAGGRVMLARMGGALLLCAAIVLVFV